ncbi:uncharacterized protein [Dysidea avara]|uniref:uncharacterized protein n=1 Tax=Dysidea avara TaxID=196820 RepID=UPI003317A80F
MMLSNLLLTVACCIFLVGSANGTVDLFSRRTSSSDVGGAYKISNSKATKEYKDLIRPRRYPHCTSGPFRRDYYQSGYFYYPPVKVWLCDDLYCKRPGKCVPTRIRHFYRWVVVYKCSSRYCYFYGIRYLKFTHHLSCKCAECTSDAHCRWPKKCNRYTWTCECPATGSCHRGYTWDRYKCKCVKKY